MTRAAPTLLAALALTSAPAWVQGQAVAPPPPPPFPGAGAGAAPPLLPSGVAVQPPPGTAVLEPLPPRPVVVGPDPYACPPPIQAPPGWFGAIEVGLVEPDLDFNLQAPVTVAGIRRRVNVPGPDLDWTGSPRLELGYRFPGGLGAFVGSYRSVVSDGTDNLGDFEFAGEAFLRSRLNMNVIDLDYLSADLPIAPFWDLRWKLGARIAAIYFDSRATTDILEARVSNNFVGGGPHFGVEVRRALDLAPGLAAFGRLEGAVVIGEATQSFEEVITSPSGRQVGGAVRFRESESVPVLNFRTGLTYAPAEAAPWFRLSFGYEFEQWWGLGDVRNNTADLSVQGLFFRGEFRY